MRWILTTWGLAMVVGTTLGRLRHHPYLDHVCVSVAAVPDALEAARWTAHAGR